MCLPITPVDPLVHQLDSKAFLWSVFSALSGGRYRHLLTFPQEKSYNKMLLIHGCHWSLKNCRVADDVSILQALRGSEHKSAFPIWRAGTIHSGSVFSLLHLLPLEEHGFCVRHGSSPPVNTGKGVQESTHLWLREWLLLPSLQFLWFLSSLRWAVLGWIGDQGVLLGAPSYSALLRNICSPYYRNESACICYY